MNSQLLCYLVAVGAWLVVTTKGSSNCCCCDVSNSYDSSNKEWTSKSECESSSNKKCCNIPSEYECELLLNPTFDGSCGHENEKSYQLKNGGVSPVNIPRNGYSDDNELQGWFGQRLIDSNGNEIQEWCFDNGDYDSFFLFRFVPCNGDYPNWFGRCVFPAANNMLIYAECDSHDYTANGCDYSEFSQTVPSCFGEVEHINIGEGSDYGRDVNYRLLPEQDHEWIWCTKYGKPTNPDTSSKTLMYDGDALGENDGMTPFYLSECRKVVNVNTFNVSSPVTMVRESNDSMARVNEMKPLSFHVSIISSLVSYPNYKEYTFKIMANYYCTLMNGDSWSLSLNGVLLYQVLNVEISSKDWYYVMKSIDSGVYMTFIYNNTLSIEMKINEIIDGFKVMLDKNATNVNYGSWIARSYNGKSNFVGFGKVSM